MKPLPWRSLSPARPGRRYVYVATFFHLRSVSTTWQFLRWAGRVQKHLESGPPGLLGFSLMAKPLSRRYWTLSAWEEPAAVTRFVRADPHRSAMGSLARKMRAFDSVQWAGSASGHPPSWEEALGRLTGVRGAPFGPAP